MDLREGNTKCSRTLGFSSDRWNTRLVLKTLENGRSGGQGINAKRVDKGRRGEGGFLREEEGKIIFKIFKIIN